MTLLGASPRGGGGAPPPTNPNPPECGAQVWNPAWVEHEDAVAVAVRLPEAEVAARAQQQLLQSAEVEGARGEAGSAAVAGAATAGAGAKAATAGAGAGADSVGSGVRGEAGAAAVAAAVAGLPEGLRAVCRQFTGCMPLA